jgi:hypothetical protein
VVIVDEVIVEMIVIMAMPNIVTTVPCSRPIIPRNVTTAALPTSIVPSPTREMAPVPISANMSAGDMSSGKAAAAEMSAAHTSTNASGTHAAEMSAAHTSTKVTAAAATAMADERDITGGRADPILQVRSAGICLSRYDRSKQQAAREGSHCSYVSHDSSRGQQRTA